MEGPLQAGPAPTGTAADARQPGVDGFLRLENWTERYRYSHATAFRNAWRDVRRGGAGCPRFLGPFL